MKNNVLAQLNSAQSAIASTLEVCMSSKNAKQITSSLTEAKTKMTEALASVQDHPNKRSLSQTKKSLTVIDNLVSGLLEGLAAREIKVKAFRAACSNLQSNFLPKLEQSISSEVEKFKAEAGESDDEISEEELTESQQEIRQAILSAAKEVSEDEEEDEEDPFDREERIAKKIEQERIAGLNEVSGDVERRLARLRTTRNLLPQAMKTPYTIVRLPVVPNFETESAKNPVLLDKLAIPYTEIPLGFSGRPTGITNPQKMERYVIFEQQFILVVSKDHVNALLEHKTEEVGEENSDTARAIRERRKALKQELATAENALEKIRKAFQGGKLKSEELKALNKAIEDNPSDYYLNKIKIAFEHSESQSDEIKRLQTKLAEYVRAVNENFKQSYTAEEKEAKKLYDKTKREMAQVHSKLEQAIGDLSKELVAELEEKETAHEAATTALNKINRKYAKSAAMKKMLDQIAIMERKLQKVNAKELTRIRMVPEAEARIKRVEAERERHEENSKNTRKEIKRSGPPLTPEDYARSVLSVINERSGSKYALVTTKSVANPRNMRDYCFWLMPAAKLSALMRSTGGKAKVMQWDFPFDREETKKLANGPSTGWVHVKDRTFEEVKDNPELLKQWLGYEKNIKDLDFETVRHSPEMFKHWLEYAKNASYRPKGWKSQFNKPKRID